MYIILTDETTSFGLTFGRCDDVILEPLNGLNVDVVAVAKTDLKKGETIDGLGGYKTYGVCENYDVSKSEKLLTMGLAEGCVLNKNISKDQVISYDDIILPEGRISDQLKTMLF